MNVIHIVYTASWALSHIWPLHTSQKNVNWREWTWNILFHKKETGLHDPPWKYTSHCIIVHLTTQTKILHHDLRNLMIYVSWLPLVLTGWYTEGSYKYRGKKTEDITMHCVWKSTNWVFADQHGGEKVYTHLQDVQLIKHALVSLGFGIRIFIKFWRKITRLKPGKRENMVERRERGWRVRRERPARNRPRCRSRD